MTTPTITLYPDTLPAKGQANAPFDTNVDNFLSWLTATNGPELATFITWTVGVRDTVLATALAGDLPPLTGEATKFLRVNAAEDGAEFRTPAEVLGDIGATAALADKAPLASPTFTGVPLVPTATLGTNTTQAASTAFVVTAVASGVFTSGEISYTDGGLTTTAHGLGVTPKEFSISAICKVADEEFLVGQIVKVGEAWAASSNFYGTTVWADATNVYTRTGTAGHRYHNPVSSGFGGATTASSWRYLLRVST
jgi:hypothetical protein